MQSLQSLTRVREPALKTSKNLKWLQMIASLFSLFRPSRTRRHATAALFGRRVEGGSSVPRFQQGGTVQGNGGGTTEVHNHIENRFSFPNLPVRNDRDLEDIKRALVELGKEFTDASVFFRKR
jgi:hypothetical protein